MWTTNFYMCFSKNISFYMSVRLPKIRSVHTYVMTRTVYFGWICIYLDISFFSRSPNGQRLTETIVYNQNGFTPCGLYNKNNSCTKAFVHKDAYHGRVIHSCLLCHFVLSGLVNIHIMSNCPLLSLLKWPFKIVFPLSKASNLFIFFQVWKTLS